MTIFNPMQCVRTPVHTDTRNPRPAYEREFEAVCDPGYREQQPGKAGLRWERYGSSEDGRQLHPRKL